MNLTTISFRIKAVAKEFIPKEKLKCLTEIRENLRAIFRYDFNSEDKNGVKRIKADFLNQVQELASKLEVLIFEKRDFIFLFLLSLFQPSRLARLPCKLGVTSTSTVPSCVRPTCPRYCPPTPRAPSEEMSSRLPRKRSSEWESNGSCRKSTKVRWEKKRGLFF